MKIYISGKITGNDDYRDKFAAAEKQLTELGFESKNPTTHESSSATTHKSSPEPEDNPFEGMTPTPYPQDEDGDGDKYDIF